MSPQGRKRAAGMIDRNNKTVSGVGGYYNQNSSEVRMYFVFL